MPKLYFKYGTMGSSKTANALMAKFNYEEKGNKVALFKPVVDSRDGVNIVRSRIGLFSECLVADQAFSFLDWYAGLKEPFDCIIIDECQFMTVAQVEQLKKLSSEVPVLCYGLRTDFTSHLFDASKRLFEIADSISEIKSVCHCGKKAIINAKFQEGRILYDGAQIDIGGNEKYIGICYECWKEGNLGKC